MKLVNWIAVYDPLRLCEIDPILRFPDFLSEQDILEILGTHNSIFWEVNPEDISLFDYAYIDRMSGLVYSNRNLIPAYISFHYTSLSAERLNELRETYPDDVNIDFIYVYVKI